MSGNVSKPKNAEYNDGTDFSKRLKAWDLDWEEIAGIDGSLSKFSSEQIKLKPKHFMAIAMLLAGSSQVDVAKALGITQRTVSRWMKEGSVFQQELAARELALMKANYYRMNNLYSKSLVVLDELLESENETIRLRVAEKVIGKYSVIPPTDPYDVPRAIAGFYYDKAHASDFNLLHKNPEAIKAERLEWTRIQEEQKKRREQSMAEYYSTTLPSERLNRPAFTLKAEEFPSMCELLDSNGLSVEVHPEGIDIYTAKGLHIAEIFIECANKRSMFRSCLVTKKSQQVDTTFFRPHIDTMREPYLGRIQFPATVESEDIVDFLSRHAEAVKDAE